MNCTCDSNCTCKGDNSNRQQLMDLINQSSFAVYDMLLYLDTHPDDMEAQAYYHKHSCIRRDALKEYARQYGPLTMDLIDDSSSDSWEWMRQPWPWDNSMKGRC